MKKTFLILLFILFQITQVFAQYNGGNGDGHDVETELNTTLTNISLTVLYEGSNGDGHDNELLLSTTLENISLVDLYQGSNGDGHANRILLSTTLENISLAILYEGGNGDGHDNETLLSTTLNNISLTVLYEGSNGDGFSSRTLESTTLGNISLAILFQGGNGDGFDVAQENVFLDPNQIVDLRLAVKVLLQGPTINTVTNGLMNDNLRADGVIPTMSPYADMSTTNATVFNLGGTTGVGTTANDIVDWVWLEIRSGLDNTIIVDDTSALLQRDGDVVALDGTSNVILRGFTDNYYVVVKHRNHNGTITLNAIPLSTASTAIDFTTNATPTFGSNAQVQLLNGAMALWAGNTNNTNQIKASGTANDINAIKDFILSDVNNGFNSATFSASGYLTQDVDMNGFAKFSGSGNDSNIIKDNVLSHPGNGFNTNTFTISETVPQEN